MRHRLLPGLLILALALGIWWAYGPPSPVEPDQSNPVTQAAPAEPVRRVRRARTGPRVPPGTEEPDEDDPGAEERRERIPNTPAMEWVTEGEVAFGANDAATAYANYLIVVEDMPDDPMAPFALYKLAWTEFNLGDFEAAADDMALVLEWTEQDDSELGRQLHTDAVRDLERFENKLEADE